MSDSKNRVEVVTVDFDDTLKMTEDGNPNPIVIQKINKLRKKADKIYIVKDLDETIIKSSGEHCLKSKKGKNLGCYPSRSGAEKREKQVNYFKHKDK
mgnify:CR=1 FL=1